MNINTIITEEVENNKLASRAKKDWERISGEALEVEQLSGAIYAYGSELACLRLFYEFNKADRNKKTNTKYSDSQKSFYFRLEV